MSRKLVLGPRILPARERVDPGILAAFAERYVPDLSDAVGPLYTMASALRPLSAGVGRLVGQALTVKCVPGDNLTVHLALRMVQPGDVLVVDTLGERETCGTGAGSLVLPARAGLRGVVTDGAWRDVAETAALGLPIIARGVSTVSPPKARAGEINVPVCCGGVIVCPGDIVVGDAEGVAVIPRAAASEVVDRVLPYVPHGRDDWPIADLERTMAAAAEKFGQMITDQSDGRVVGF